jgi:hypothetical protein
VLADHWYLLAPVVAIVMIAVLAALLRWVFADPDRPAGPPGAGTAEPGAATPTAPPAADPAAAGPAATATTPVPAAVDVTGRQADFGLLCPVAGAPDQRTADDLRARLRAAGIRSTTARRGGQVQVLVFESEAARARRLVG